MNNLIPQNTQLTPLQAYLFIPPFTPPSKIISTIPPRIIRFKWIRSCCQLCGSISGITKCDQRYKTCKFCKDTIKNAVEKRYARIQRKIERVGISLVIRECLHYNHIGGFARYMSTFI